ncbi:MAG: 2-C-methyl-D-erythritol 2,4-cyclodiphosphate synthase [Phycisphaerae bacterium]
MAADRIHRVGIGTDLHRLAAGGSLRLGGVDIPFDRRLEGHSDADVVLHAVIDALCGAAGLPDIGEHFPDDDLKYAGCDSGTLLSTVVEEIARLGYAVVNVDVVIHAERPKLSPHKEAMRESIAALVRTQADRVSVKAKTNEGLDAVGRGEAIACTAIVGLSRREVQETIS